MSEPLYTAPGRIDGPLPVANPVHPALSVIAFTTLSGAGYGLLIWLGVVALEGLPVPRSFAWLAGGIALGLVTGGLLSSLAHLGRPERAWRALSQWRSSWLSREGVAAILTYVPAVVVIARLLQGRADVVAGALLVAACVLTLYCTAQIYRSLKTVRAWHNSWTTPGYLLQALWTGTAIGWLLFELFDLPSKTLRIVLIAATALVFLHTLGYRRWRTRQPVGDAGHATGLTALGNVRSFERPHTEENYLLREMGFVLARKHALKLEHLALAGASLAAGCALSAGLLPADGASAIALSALAVVGSVFATFVERWLFFALARHVVTLYYGGDAAGHMPASSRPAPFANS